MDKQRLKELLMQPELQVYTCVRIALKLLDKNNIQEAIELLKVDLDKIRIHNIELYEMLNK